MPPEGGFMSGVHRGQRQSVSKPVAAALVLAVVAVLGLGGYVVFGRGGDGATTASATGPAQATPTSEPSAATAEPTTGAATGTAASSAPASDDRASAAAVQCRAEVEAAARALSTARVSVNDWTAHVNAQIRLDNGTFSPAQTDQVFTRTRLAGPARVARFESHEGAWRAASGACRSLDVASEPVDVQPAARTCRDLAAVMAADLTAARRTIGEWKQHLTNMQARRSGHMDPSVAGAAWRQAVQQAPVAQRAFQAADALVRAHEPCTLPSTRT
jgi:hypothetical protein